MDRADGWDGAKGSVIAEVNEKGVCLERRAWNTIGVSAGQWLSGELRATPKHYPIG